MMVAMGLAVNVVVVVMVAMMVMLPHGSRIGAGGAEDRHRERQGKSQPERGQEGLLHDFVSFRGRSEIHRTKSANQASRSGLSSWILSTIFPDCRFLYPACFRPTSAGVRASLRTRGRRRSIMIFWNLLASSPASRLTSAERRHDCRPPPGAKRACRCCRARR